MCCKNVILRVLYYRETDVKKNYYFPKKVFRIIYKKKKKEDGDYNDSYLFPGRARPAGITNIVMSMGEKKPNKKIQKNLLGRASIRRAAYNEREMASDWFQRNVN